MLACSQTKLLSRVVHPQEAIGAPTRIYELGIGAPRASEEESFSEKIIHLGVLKSIR